MRKVFFALFIYGILFSVQLKAQQFQSGLRLGLNAAQINGDRMGGFNKAGAVGGIFVAYPFSEKFSGQFEMLYSAKGSRRVISAEYVQGGLWNDLTLHYIEVPLLVNYNLNKKIGFHAGTGAGYLFGAKLIDTFETIGNTDFLKKFDLNVFAGATYKFSPRFSAYARYSNSILSIGKGESSSLLLPQFGGLISLVASFGIYYHFLGPEE